MLLKSNIWSGMVKEIKGFGLIGSDPVFDTIQAEWNVPTITGIPTDPNAQVLIWIGIGGGGPLRHQPATHNVIQVGTGAKYDAFGNPAYYAWWEAYGMPDDRGENLLDEIQYKVEPGDKIRAWLMHGISFPGAGTGWEVNLRNDTQNWTYAQYQFYNGDQTTAEFIVEAPQNFASGVPFPLANYGSVTFEKCFVNQDESNFPISDMCNMFDPKNPNKIISTPSNLHVSTGPYPKGGEGFTVSYVP
ncbi:hypothetical protein COM83_04455 [Bacillus cereus]|nr:hypothetical protein COM83_04455 [Bacillus cereus]PFW04107.1 hypothetical protein COL18_30270 [Bacillus cereus]PGW93314.1 hypothetical protein COE40_29135 [Bacillus cereus]PGY19793.1 hypothetical protein COE16_16935 [Bacillus cereus]